MFWLIPWAAKKFYTYLLGYPKILYRLLAYVQGSVYLDQVLCLDIFFSASGWVQKKKRGGRECQTVPMLIVRVLVCLPLFLPANSTEEVGSRQAFLNQVRVYHLEAHRRLVHAAVPNGTHRAFNFRTSQDGAAAAVRLKLKTNRLCGRKNRSGAFSS